MEKLFSSQNNILQNTPNVFKRYLQVAFWGHLVAPQCVGARQNRGWFYECNSLVDVWAFVLKND